MRQVGRSWTHSENIDLVALYFDLLDRSLQGGTFSHYGVIQSHQTVNGCHQRLSSRSADTILLKLRHLVSIHQHVAPDGAATLNGHGYLALEPDYAFPDTKSLRRVMTSALGLRNEL